jgi:flagellar biogenesis protein FliO
MDMKNMPAKPLVFQSGTMSAGLELVDIYLWIFKRFMEGKELTKPLSRLVTPILRQRELTVFPCSLSLNGLRVFEETA